MPEGLRTRPSSGLCEMPPRAGRRRGARGASPPAAAATRRSAARRGDAAEAAMRGGARAGVEAVGAAGRSTSGQNLIVE